MKHLEYLFYRAASQIVTYEKYTVVAKIYSKRTTAY